MPIVMRLDRVMADRKMSSLELAEKVGISPVNISRIKTGRLKGIRFSTLEAMCIASPVTSSIGWMTRNILRRSGHCPKHNRLFFAAGLRAKLKEKQCTIRLPKKYNH